MNPIQNKSIAALLVAILITGVSISTVSAQESGRRRQGPPPEAYTACEGKTEGDTAQLETPRGDTISGTCEQEGDRLVLRPERGESGPGGPGGAGKGFHGPPPEAYTACEGKRAGDTAQVETPRGATISGTCEQEGDHLVLRPDHPPRRRGGGANDQPAG